ncbi:sodium/hydrogen exchanger 1-like [Haliotis rubra]|uniref:sodium/hydrogen exchanger 1-like n=1 Tax=Haliotis rubra TaxID=36100 RepID=UPI001EE51953|nr:sodium/hydrogen exchanger 1-like [Haliotis rubra]XP_046542879.1 sodium/hydrogen exchanger 1-like [Haliotis rubra]XP_046542880.1 sodium/hydrogen exchanger 1-like [Haliotis rubra]XP_046542881.1 sodium/hydrogen exchanger 1-like [Haliotis rubra]XP_046542882.1 sodium/hydrogen exchanger 1-like [Haliotis rubra]XP_046542883.1 sodium/hydrogen exchanger 1-like [Haliotis rubra]XP_046542884.1 sodium/hydrogen exchanger 1-like [Haliotis rubra]XP_046542885.1 sodium/hydrogen exchanger 1-like [Haliotis ru
MAFASTLSLCVFYCSIFATSTSSVDSSELNVTHGHRNITDGHHDKAGHRGHHGIEIAGVLFDNVREPLIYTIVVILAAISKVAFHHAHFLSSKIPESCLLIILGLIFGAIIEYSGAAAYMPEFFSPHDFFQYLLPPIILESSFSLHDRTFADNIGSVLLFAVIGTICAFFTLGLTLYGLAISGAMGVFPFEFTLIQILIFAALIVAVDPVAVLAVFQEIGVNNVLYFMVFGESLLNDGVTVVLYQVMQTYNELALSGQGVDGEQIGLGILKFFVVCFGGLALGVLAGIVTALLTKYTRHVKIAQPLIVYTMAYLGFLLAELFEFSGIISIIGCGLVQVQYSFHNISDKSRTTVKYFTKVISTTNEIIIFLFLGLAMIRKKNHMWHTGFVLWTVFFCLLYRFFITFVLSFLINKLDNDRTRRISYDEQFMIAYGGLRGAVCFSLVALLDEKALPPGMKDMFETATLVVIFFTVFVQGISIKPLVKLLRVQLAQKKQLSMYQDLNEHVTDHLMAGVEEIVGFRGRYTIKEELERFEDRYIRKWLQLEPELSQTQLQEFYHKILLKEHYKHLQLGGVSARPAHGHIPRIETSLYLAEEDHDNHVAPGAVAVPEKKKKEKHKAKHIDAYGLSGLLKMHHGASALHRKWDKNLTEEHHGNLANHIQMKTAKNRRIQSHKKSSSRNQNATPEKVAQNGTGSDVQCHETPCLKAIKQ